MKGWKRRRGHLVAELTQPEATMLRGMVSQVRQILDERGRSGSQDELADLTGMTIGPSSAPEDPALARLLPDFHRDDEGLSGGMRSLHEPELIAHKDGVAVVVLDTCPPDGGTVRLSDEQAQSWLSALNDVRLVLGTTLEVTEDMPDELPADDPRAEHLPVYHWLTWVQESLVQALS